MTEKDRKMRDIISEIKSHCNVALCTLSSVSTYKKNQDWIIDKIIELGQQLQITRDFE